MSHNPNPQLSLYARQCGGDEIRAWRDEYAGLVLSPKFSGRGFWCFGAWADLNVHMTREQTVCHTADGCNMDGSLGDLSIGDVLYFDGSSCSQPSDAAQNLLRLLSVNLNSVGNPGSVFPFTSCDVGVAKDKELVRYIMDVFSILSGHKIENKEDGSNIVYRCPKASCNFSVKFRVLKQNNNARGMLELVEVVGHKLERSPAVAVHLGDIPPTLMMAICLKVVCEQLDGEYAECLDTKILKYLDSVGTIVTENQAKAKRTMRHCFRYNKLYFNEKGMGFCEASMLSNKSSLFEYYSLVRRVRVTRKDIAMTASVIDELKACKYQPTTVTAMEEEVVVQQRCQYCFGVHQV